MNAKHVLNAEDYARSRATYRARLDARFWDWMDRSGGPDACWPWIGARDGPGYGLIRRHGRVIKAHRVALERHLGRPLPVGEYALHHCDNPPCCNPSHLFAGTIADNNADMIAKGRHRSGGPGWRKLTVEQRALIVSRRRDGETPSAIARSFAIHPSTVARLVRSAT